MSYQYPVACYGDVLFTQLYPKPLIPAKAGIQLISNVRALLALYSLDTQSGLGMSGF